jgi:acyl-CoA synthetase (AMP-forming)/AMP-acid ligase II
MPHGVTQEMLDRYKDLVFEKSVNVQVRRGDPVRCRDWAAVEAQRELQGLDDAAIATQLGLTEEQVTFIRIYAEKERYHLESHAVLYRLHGNRAEHVGTYAAAREAAERGAGRAQWLRGRTLGDVLRAVAAARPTHLALVDRGRGTRYAELLARGQVVAAGLRRLGLGRGDVLAAQLPGCAEFLVLHVALAEIGAVLNPIPMTYRGREVEYVLRDAHARGVVLPGEPRYAEAVELVERLRPALPHLAHAILVGGTARPGTVPWDALLADEGVAGAPHSERAANDSAADAREADGPPTASDPFVLLYTSGTEGPPKGVVHSHDTLLSNASWLVGELGVEPGDTLLTASPIAHLFALYLFYVGLHAGARNVVLERFEPAPLVELLARERVSVLGLAPAQLLALLRAPNLADHDLSALRLAITSGAPCPASAYQEAVARLGCQVVNQWGMTETQAGALTRPGDPLERTLTSTGRAAPGVELLVTDDRGLPLPPDAEGHLWYRSPYLFLGYHDKPEATRAAFAPGGWFRTGDLAALDTDGYLRLLGRSKDLVNRGGVKFHPGEIEDLLLGHPAVREAAIVPMPDVLLGERACLYASLHEGLSLTLDEVAAFLLERGVAKYKLPERLEVVAELPTTSSRKVQKGPLREDIARKLAAEAAGE